LVGLLSIADEDKTLHRPHLAPTAGPDESRAEQASLSNSPSSRAWLILLQIVEFPSSMVSLLPTKKIPREPLRSAGGLVVNRVVASAGFPIEEIRLASGSTTSFVEPASSLEVNPTVAPDPFPGEMKAYGWMLLGAISFAFMGAFTHLAGESVDWRFVAVIRAVMSCLIACAIAWRHGSRLVVIGTPTVWLRSLSGSISLLATFYALTALPIAECLALTNMFPLWVVFLSWPMLGHLPRAAHWLAAGLAVAGVGVMGAAEVQHADFAWNPAYLVALGASVTSAIAMIGLHRLRGMAPSAIVAHFSGVGVIFCVAALLMPGTQSVDLSRVTPAVLLLTLCVGVTATAGQLCITRAFASGPPSKVAVVALTQVVFAFILDLMLWHRPFDGWKMIGMALILLPTAWVMTHPSEDD
jgi:drug/metabolite transporter (DMT)-like permease